MNGEERLLDRIGQETPVEIQRTVVNGYTIQAVVAGSGEPLLLLHGGNFGFGQWYKNIGTLAQQYRVYAVDLPGAGGSSPIDPRTFRVPADYVPLLEDWIKILGLQNLRVVAHSFSGWIALQLASRQNVSIKKLVFVNVLGFSRYIPLAQRLVALSPFVGLMAKTAMYPSQKNLRRFFSSAFYAAANLEDDFVEYIYHGIHHRQVMHPLRFLHLLTERFGLKKILFSEDAIRSVKQPSLVLLGRHDPLLPFETQQMGYALLPNKEIYIINGAGHVPFIEKKDEFHQRVFEFLHQ
ncbi:MAG: alpha/beta hydrolase [Patescibacteria group bacterium]